MERPSLLSTTVAVALSTLSAGPASAQSVRGIVSEAVTEVPIELATVRLFESSGTVLATTLTDANGFFHVDIPKAGEYILRAEAFGYRTGRSDVLQVLDDAMQIIYVSLEPAPVAIEGVEVEAPGAEPTSLRPSLAERGFWERAAEGRGQFLLPGQIANADVNFTTELFEGMDHVMTDYRQPVWRRGVDFLAATERGNCSPRIFVDGIRMSMLLAEGDFLSDIAPIDDVLAVESFWGPFQAPGKYQGTTVENSCGVVLIWTRRRTKL